MMLPLLLLPLGLHGQLGSVQLCLQAQGLVRKLEHWSARLVKRLWRVLRELGRWRRHSTQAHAQLLP